MKTILEIYQEYKIMPSLQMHMLRVAAVASLICDNFTEPLNKEELITACLLHDMGNIVKFNTNILPEFYEPEGVEYWRKIQNEFKDKYGLGTHEVTLKIAGELNISSKVKEIINSVEFNKWCSHKEEDNFYNKLAIYADSRVSPHGVASYDERMEDGRKRYETKENGLPNEERQRFVDCGKEIEKQIFAKCKIKPEDITDAAVAPIIEELKGFVIK